MLHAEFDPAARVMLAVLDDDDPFAPRRPTGAPRTPGVEPLVLPLRTRWPDPYLPDLPELLGPMVLEHDAAAGTLTQTYPGAMFTPEAVRGARRAQLDREVRDVLTRTDWTVVRLVETGRAIPPRVAAHRQSLRDWHELTEGVLTTAEPAALVDGARWRLPDELAQPPA